MGLEITFPCDREGVLALLPHRDPFVWVSRIVSCEPAKFIRGELDVDPERPCSRAISQGTPFFPASS